MITMSENSPTQLKTVKIGDKKTYLSPLYFKKNKTKDEFYTEKVCKKVALLYDLNIDLVVRGTDPISRKARKICYYVLQKKKGFPLRNISTLFGRKYIGTTVHLSIKEITNFLASEEPDCAAEIRNIKKLIETI